MTYPPDRHLIEIEMCHRFNPPDHPLVVLSISLLTGLFVTLPVFYPDPELWHINIAYVRMALVGLGILAGFWCLILVLLMLIDFLSHRPTYPSEKVKHRPAYYVYKYINLGYLTLGITLSGVLAVHRFLQQPMFTFLYVLLLGCQGGYVLLKFKNELLALYRAYGQINRGRNIGLSFLGMFIFSTVLIVDNLTDILSRPIAVSFMFVIHIWAAWYFLRLSLLNFGRAVIHAGAGRILIMRSE